MKSMKKMMHETTQETLHALNKETAKYSNSELFEFANKLDSLECPHTDLAVAFAAYLGMNVEMVCSAWEYRFYNASPPHDDREKLLTRFDEIVALIKRNVRT
jgi:hypothetical protein